ncbi:MAG: trypsin-like peptidase domain-containing protein [Pirellulaceae bacterium]
MNVDNEPNELEAPDDYLNAGEAIEENEELDESEAGPSTARQPRSTSPLHLVASTILSLVMVLALLLIARLVVPSLVENIRYGWHRGQLRAEYEASGQRLKSISLDSLADVSQLVSQRVGPSVVHVNLLREQNNPNALAALLQSNELSLRYEGQGSGFVIDRVGHILTNHHVIDGSGSIEVTLSDGRVLPASVVGKDSLTDLAVVKVDALDLMPVDWGNSDDVFVGMPVWAIGSPFGLQQTVTFGIISGKHRVDLRGTRYNDTVGGGNAYGDLMQSDVALNPGNSGGPLVNSQGEVVGVNAAILGETYRGVSFSIPSQVALRVATSLIIQGEVPRGWLGIYMMDEPIEQRFDQDGHAIPGVRIKAYPRSGPSPARDAGLLPGDLIVEFAGQPVFSQVELMKMIGESSVGSLQTVAVIRNGERSEFDVMIGKRVE